MADEPMVTMTERAAGKVRQFLDAEGHAGNMLRVAIVRTHCMGGRGHSYRLEPEEEPAEDDVVQDTHGLRLLVRPGDAPRLQGVTIDYHEGLEGAGFSVENPHAAGKCPCGHHDLFE